MNTPNSPYSRRQILAAGAALGAAAPLVLSGCASSPVVEDYAGQKPLLDLRRFFNGDVQAQGLFFDRAGRVVKRFSVLMHCHWQGDDGTLDEHFTYSDGSLQRRVWRLNHQGDGRYSGQADDVVGIAQGRAAGNTFHWQYTLRLPVDGRVWDVDMDDWMVLMDERVLLNKATMRKFGVQLGEVQLAFQRLGAQP